MGKLTSVIAVTAYGEQEIVAAANKSRMLEEDYLRYSALWMGNRVLSDLSCDMASDASYGMGCPKYKYMAFDGSGEAFCKLIRAAAAIKEMKPLEFITKAAITKARESE